MTIKAQIKPSAKIVSKQIISSSLSKEDVSLGNVNNTSDADKPISTLTQAALNLKADASNVYSKSEVYTQAQVNTKIGDVVGGAPETLDTLKELSDALGSNTNFATTTAAALGEKLVKGNNLSDLTDAAVARTNLGLGNVNNKSSETIISEIVDADIPSTITRDSELLAHTSLTDNPHSVTAAQLGLGNVTNESKTTMFTNPHFTGDLTANIGQLSISGNIIIPTNRAFIKQKAYYKSGGIRLQHNAAATDEISMRYEGINPAPEGQAQNTNFIIEQIHGNTSKGQIKFIGNQSLLRLSSAIVEVGKSGGTTKLLGNIQTASAGTLLIKESRSSNDGLLFDHSGGAGTFVQMGMYGNFNSSEQGDFKITHKTTSVAANTDVLVIPAGGDRLRVEKDLYVDAVNSTVPPLFVDVSDKKVGIGTNLPQAKLHIKADTGGSGSLVRQLQLHNDSNDLGSGSGILFANQAIDTYTSATIDSVNTAGSSGDLRFSTKSGPSEILLERMRINHTGEVGIGKTAASGVELDVNGDIAASGSVTGATLVGTLSTAAQTNITSVGTLNGLTVNGTINHNATFSGNHVDVSSLTTGNFTCSGSTSLSNELTVTDEVKITPVSGRGLHLYSTGSSNQSVSAYIEGPTTVGHDIFRRSGFTDGFADGSNHFHSLIDINRIEQEAEGDVKNTQRVQERYYAIQDNLLPNSKAVFWAQHRVARPISTTVVDTSTGTLNVSLLQNSSNRNANNQVFFVSNTTPLNKSEEITITMSGHPLALGDSIRMEFSQAFAGPIVAAQLFGKVTFSNSAGFKVELYGGNYKTTSEVPLGTDQTALSFDNVILESIGTNTIVQSSNETNLQLYSKTNFTPERLKDETLKATWSVAHGLVKNEHCTLITDGRDDLVIKQAAYVLDPDPDGDGLSVILVYGRRIKQFDLGSFTAFGSTGWTLHKGSIDGIHDDTLGDNLINFNANNHGDYTAYQIGPGSQTDADCIAIGKNVYNKDASTIKIGYDNEMLDVRSDCISVDGNIGVGTTAPAAQLHVVGSGTIGQNPSNFANATIRVENSGVNLYIDGNEVVTSDNLYLQSTKDSGFVSLAADDSTGTRVNIANASATGFAIGKGTAAASRPLDVTGETIFRGNATTPRPSIILDKPDADNGIQQSRITIGVENTEAAFEIQTYTNDNVFVSNDYRIEKDTSGAKKHEFRIGNSNRFVLEDAGISVTGNTTISGDLTVDTDTLKVDSANHRVGIGTLSPSVELEVTGSAIITGDLTVNGTTTTVNQTNLDVSDNIIGLNRGAATNANDSGLIIERGSTGDNAAILWDESADKFVLGTTTSDASSSGNLTITTGNLDATLTTAAQPNITSVGNHFTVALAGYNDATKLIGAKLITDSAGGSYDHPYLDLRRWTGVNTDHRVASIELTPESADQNAIVFKSDTKSTNTKATTERMRIDKNGNVGIGTTSSIVDQIPFLEKALIVQAGDSSSTTLQQAGIVIAGSSDSDDADDFGSITFVNNHSTLTYNRVANILVLKDGTDVNASEISFSTADGSTLNEGLRIDKDGNVGIGTPSPSEALEVAGNINLSGDITANGKLITSDKEFVFEVNDESNLSGNKWYKIASVNNNNGGLHIRGFIANHVESYASQKLDIAINGRESNSGTNIEIIGTVDVLHNDETGTDKAGIRIIKAEDGTDTYDRYDVYVRTCRYNQLRLQLTRSGNTSFFTSPTPVTSEPQPISTDPITEIDTSSFLPGTHTITDSQVRHMLKEDGRVGIGTTSPGSMLHVKGDGSTTIVKAHIENSSTGQAGVDIENSEGHFRIITDGGAFRVYDQTDAADRMAISTSGNVGIGTTSPSETLDVVGNIAASGDVINLYNKEVTTNTESGDASNYYHDTYNGTRNLNGYIKNSKSDLIRYRPIDNYEYWDGSAWVADSSKIDEVKKLLDGRQDTRYNVPARDYKFRFTVTPTTSYPTTAKVAMHTTWTGSSYPGSKMIVEEYSSGAWETRVTAKFGNGNSTPLETTDNNCENWGLSFISTDRLHTGNGGASQATRITVDFYGWTPSNSNYVTIPLQNLHITSNYTGVHNTDYSNLLDYDRNLKSHGTITPGIYADTSARDTAIPSPTAGMMVFITSGTKFQGYTGSAWVDFN